MSGGRNNGSKPPRDPRGHNLRIYADIYDSPAFKSLSPHDVMAYLALLRELKGYNNGDLSLPLSRAKNCGISHHLTLARSLRALCAVGLIAVTRKGGCAKGGQRLANLYRVTDRECYDHPAKHLTAMKDTNEWRTVASIEQGHSLIAAAEEAAKAKHEKKALGHGVTVTRTRRDVVGPKTRTPRDTWPEGLGHGVTMAGKAANPSPARVSTRFSPSPEKASHRTPHVSPLYIATPTQAEGDSTNQGRQSSAPAVETPEALPAPARHAPAIDTLTDLWAAVGMGSNPLNKLRLTEAAKAVKHAERRQMTRQRPAPAGQLIRICDGDFTRERDPEFMEAQAHGW